MVITTVITVTSQGCTAATTSINQRVAVSCCKFGISYARPPKEGSINCFQHVYPNTTCSADAPTLHGVFSQGPANTILTVYDTTAQRCAGLADVGNVIMKCNNDKVASFTLTSRNTDPDAVQFVMMTCNCPKKRPSSCPDFTWVRVDKVKKKQVDSGDEVSTETAFTAELPNDASCSCQDAYWAVHEGAIYTGLPVRMCRK